jgi:hypothetical protein
MSSCKGNTEKCIKNRLFEGHHWAFEMLTSGFYSEAYNEARPGYLEVYPGPGSTPVKGQYVADKNSFKKIYKKKAIEIGLARYKSMQKVLSSYRYLYLKEPESQKNITQLAYSIRAWLPFVAYSPFLTLKTRPDENNDKRFWEDNVPKGPAPPDTSNVSKHADFIEKYVQPDLITRTINPKSAELQRKILRNATIAKYIERNAYVRWRESPTSQRDPRTLSMQSLAHLHGGNSDQFRQFIYDRDPILLLLAEVASPRQLENILNKDPHHRDKVLKKLVRKATDKLEVTAEKFLDDLTKDPIPWDRYNPLLGVAKHELFPMPVKDWPKRKKTQAMHNLMNEFDRELSPWTPKDTINAVAIGISICVTLATIGTLSPITISMTTATIATVSIDLGLVGWNTYQNHLENQERVKLNSFGHVDAALKIASPEMDLSDEALFLGASYLVGPFLGATVRSGRKAVGVLTKRAVTRAIEEVPGKIGHTATRGASGSTRAIEEVPGEIGHTANRGTSGPTRAIEEVPGEIGHTATRGTSGSTRATNETQETVGSQGKTVDSRGLETAAASGTIQNRQVLNQAESGYLSRSTLPIPGKTLLLPNGQPPKRLVVGGTVETLKKEASGNQKAIEGIKQLEPGDLIMNTNKSAGHLPDYMGSVYANIENLEDILRATNRQMIEVDEVYIQRIGFFGKKGRSITNPLNAFRNCAAFLKKGGTIEIITGNFFKEHRDDIVEALRDAGFKDVIVRRTIKDTKDEPGFIITAVLK